MNYQTGKLLRRVNYQTGNFEMGELSDEKTLRRVDIFCNTDVITSIVKLTVYFYFLHSPVSKFIQLTNILYLSDLFAVNRQNKNKILTDRLR